MARGRNRKGQFTKRSSGGATATAIVAAPRRSVARRSSRSVARGSGGVPRGRRRGGSRGNTSTRGRAELAGAGFAIGYANRNYASTIQKLPAIKGSHIMTAGIASHFLIKPTPGSIADRLTDAAVVIGGYEIGGSGVIGDSGTPTWRG